MRGAGGLDDSAGGAEGGDGDDVFGAGAQAVFLPAPHPRRREGARALAQHESPRARIATELVGRTDDGVDSRRGSTDAAQTLRGVGDDDAARVDNGGDRVEVDDQAGFIVGGGDDDGIGAFGAAGVDDDAFVNDVEHDDETVFVVPTRKPTTNRETDSGVLVRGSADILVKLAKCCTPVPGDTIVGFITRGNGVSVHREDCPNVKGFDGELERMIEVEWAGSSSTVFRVHIQVEALDRGGLLSDITRVLSEHHVNILTATVQTDSQRLATSRFVFEMSDTTHLDRVLSAVRRIDAVYDVYRVNSG